MARDVREPWVGEGERPGTNLLGRGVGRLGVGGRVTRLGRKGVEGGHSGTPCIALPKRVCPIPSASEWGISRMGNHRNGESSDYCLVCLSSSIVETRSPEMSWRGGCLERQNGEQQNAD